jgi:dCMP deaminase
MEDPTQKHCGNVNVDRRELFPIVSSSPTMDNDADADTDTDDMKQTPHKRLKLQEKIAATTTPTAPIITPAATSFCTNKDCCSPSATAATAAITQEEQEQVVQVTVTPKRKDYLSWDDYFFAVAILSAKRSKDPNFPSGACIVDEDNHIIGIGYNGFPRGCSDDALPWTSTAATANNDNDDSNKTPWLHTKDPYVCHAVTNAILNKCRHDIKGCRLYVVRFPCSECAKVLIQSRIQEVVVLDTKNNNHGDHPLDQGEHQAKADDHADTQASRILLNMAGIGVRYYRPKFPSVSLDFVSALAPTTVETTLTADDAATGSSRSRSSNEEGDHDGKAPTPSATTTTIPEETLQLLWKEAKHDPRTSNCHKKRNDYISWQDYFMAMAFLTAKRSKDPNTQVGACIVNAQNRIVGLGYNGFPRGCSDDHLPWARSNANELHNKYLYVCHAEINSILNGSANVEGASIYVALFPCQNCAKMIIQAGIKEVVYMSDAYHDTDGCRSSRILFQMAKVKLRRYIPSVQSLTLDYETSAY